MAIKKLPFNITFLSNQKKRLETLLPVTSMDIYDTEGNYHPQGLYSTAIFGNLGDHKRQVKMSYIDMRAHVLHPKMFLELTRLKGLYKSIMSGQAHAIWNPKLKDFERCDLFEGDTGYHFFMSHLEELKLQRNKSPQRDLRIDMVEKQKDNRTYRYMMVLPAGLRDIRKADNGQDEEDELAKMYRSVITTANTISAQNATGKQLDGPRWSLQMRFNEIYFALEKVISNRKRGMLLEKYAARNLYGGTRNVITGMDPSHDRLHHPSNPTVSDSVLGLHQSLIGTIDLSIYLLKNGPMRELIDALPGNVHVVDKKTLKSKVISPSIKTRDKWGTIEGLEKVLMSFENAELRDNPVLIDGEIVALIYRDGTTFFILHDIDELPEGYDRKLVKPITWGELLFVSCHEIQNRAMVWVTRYPILTDGSTYPSTFKLKTTADSESLVDGKTGRMLYEFPAVDRVWFDSAQVHVSRVKDLGADYDGDKCSFNFITSKEAVASDRKYLESKEQFISSSGGLRFGVKNHIAFMALHNLTGGME